MLLSRFLTTSVLVFSGSVAITKHPLSRSGLTPKSVDNHIVEDFTGLQSNWDVPAPEISIPNFNPTKSVPHPAGAFTTILPRAIQDKSRRSLHRKVRTRDDNQEHHKGISTASQFEFDQAYFPI
jgi:hypothetical protein